MMDRMDATPALTEPLEHALDDDSFTPRLLALLSNALIWAQSQAMREQAGLATNDWRVISALASHPGLSAKEISETLAVNKAVISTSARVLADRGLIVHTDGPRGSRPMYLTAAGAAIHDELLPIAKRGLDLIEDELGADGAQELNALLLRLTERARAL